MLVPVAPHLTLLARSCREMIKLGNFCTVSSHSSSRGADIESYAEDPDLVERSNAVPPSKDLRSGALAAGGGAMLATAVARAAMAAANCALVSTMLRIRARSERSVAILIVLLEQC